MTVPLTTFVLHVCCCTQERTNPQLLISSASRRRRIAEGSGRTEAEVSELMTAFTQMKAQTSNMSKLMKLSQGGLQSLGECGVVGHACAVKQQRGM